MVQAILFACNQRLMKGIFLAQKSGLHNESFKRMFLAIKTFLLFLSRLTPGFVFIFDAVCILHLLSKDSITATTMKNRRSLALLPLALQGSGAPLHPPKWF